MVMFYLAGTYCNSFETTISFHDRCKKVSEFSDLRITYPSLLVENSCPKLDIISTSDNGFFEILLITNNVSALFIDSWEVSLLRNSIKNKIPNLWDWGCWKIDEIILHLLSRRVCRYGSIWLSWIKITVARQPWDFTKFPPNKRQIAKII